MNVAVQEVKPASAAPIDRQKIASGWIVRAYVSGHLKVVTCNDDAGKNTIEYIPLLYRSDSGSIMRHVRGQNLSQFIGKKITARAELWKKTFPDGRSVMYLDLYPVDEPRTHKVRVCAESNRGRYENARFFSMPGGAGLALALVPLGPAGTPSTKRKAPPTQRQGGRGGRGHTHKGSWKSHRHR